MQPPAVVVETSPSLVVVPNLVSTPCIVKTANVVLNPTRWHCQSCVTQGRLPARRLTYLSLESKHLTIHLVSSKPLKQTCWRRCTARRICAVQNVVD